MITFDLIEFVAVAFVVCGLAVVIWEIAAKDPRSFGEMMTDVRGFAQRPLPRPAEQPGPSAPASPTPESKAPDLAA